MDDNLFAKRLKKARVKAGYSQRRLGIDAGLDQFVASPRINRYEQGRHMPSDLGLVQKIGDLLGVPVPYFFCPDDTMAELIRIIGMMDGEERKTLLERLGRETQL
jgi:transcriptional regulator with XRE-family HTH domain